MINVLYLEDDKIDQMIMQRFVESLKDVSLEIITTLQSTSKLDLNNYNLIISDANLSDANPQDIIKFFQGINSFFLISGAKIKNVIHILKPLHLSSFKVMLKSCGINLDIRISGSLDDDEHRREILNLAITVLPKRIDAIINSWPSQVFIAQNVHKAISSFRVLGLDTTILDRILVVGCDHDQFFKLCQELSVFATVANQKIIRSLDQ